jgi:hypothetical protein
MADSNVVALDAPQTTPEPPPLWERLPDGSVKVRLVNKPIRALDQTLSEITFREPSGVDLDLVGDPFPAVEDAKGRFSTTVNWSVLIEMLARLANVPVGSIRSMKSRDLETCRWAVLPFFLPGGPPTESQSNSPS